MKEDQFHLLTQSIEKVIQEKVNGKIDRLTEKLDEHMESHDRHWITTQEFMEEMKPALDGLRFVQIVQKFFKWIGLPLTVVIIPLWLWLRN